MVSLARSAFTSAYLLQAHRPSAAPSLRRGSVVHGISGTMDRSDSRSALPRFAGTPLIGLVAPGRPPEGAPQGSHGRGGDGSLLFPRRLSHRSAPLTPRGSWGLRLQALHPVLGLRPPNPGSAPRCSPRGANLSARQASLPATDRWLAPSDGPPPRA